MKAFTQQTDTLQLESVNRTDNGNWAMGKIK